MYLTWLVGEVYARRMTTIFLQAGMFKTHYNSFKLFNKDVYILHKLMIESVMDILDAREDGH